MKTQVDLFVRGENGYNTYRIPVLAATSQDTLLCFTEARKNSSADHGDIKLMLKRSTDRGKTWTKSQVVHGEDGDTTIGNPAPIIDRDGQTIHLIFSRNNHDVFYTKSVDDGQTWAQPGELAGILKEFDYPVVRVGTGPVHGIQTTSGRLVVPLWLCNGEVKDNPKNYRSGVIYSDNAGESWNAGGLVPPVFPNLNECVAYERKDGSLVLNIRGSDKGRRAISISSDQGKTWSNPALDDALPCPSCQASVLRLSENELLFSNPATAFCGSIDTDSRKNMSLALSFDEGATWPVRRVLNPGQSGYSDLAVLKDGSICCVFECGEVFYNEKISFARFTRDWLIQEPDNQQAVGR